MLSIYLFLLASKRKNSLLYCLSAASFSLCMYSYGAATIVVPVVLVLIAVYSVKEKALTIRQLLAAIITFAVVFAPLFLFYAINYLGVPEIITDVVTFNRFTAARTGEAFASFGDGFFKGIADNLKSMMLTVSIGNDQNTTAHYLKGYATLFAFTFPVTFLGFTIGVKELFSKGSDEKGQQGRILNAMFVFVTLGSIILDLVILPDIQRLVLLFVPLIYFFVLGAVFIF